MLKSLTDSKTYISSIEEVLDKIKYFNNHVFVRIEKTNLSMSSYWFMSDQGIIKNKSNSFFYISGITSDDNDVFQEQPIIVQDEIGFLGIITKEIDGNLYFLMQAKIEPGNINKIQISPTIQATKSNFQQKHGGKKPEYLDYFINAEKHEIILDQIQSEQSSRFYKKRNRNVIIKVTDEVKVQNTHFWLTLYQLKQLLKIDNLVNMDTRTVLASIPYYQIDDYSNELFIYPNRKNSMFGKINFKEVIDIFNKINDLKMYYDGHINLTSLKNLQNWNIDDYEIVSKEPYNFKVIYCDIEIEGREVKKWSQPLLEATGIATFGLICSEIDNNMKFLVKFTPEIGSFDIVELGPTVQKEAIDNKEQNNIEKLFFDKLNNPSNILYDVMLSEEGGRFYHEQNRNIIIEIKANELGVLPNNYMWVDYKTLNFLMLYNNVLNIQLRNLLALIEV